MTPDAAFPVFESMTAKQHETMRLAVLLLTSKEIAAILGVAPVTVDKRIEALRARLGSIPRNELIRLYRQWCNQCDGKVTYGRAISDPIILAEEGNATTYASVRSVEPQLEFEDSTTQVAFASASGSGRQELRPDTILSAMGVSGKLVAMLVGAVIIMMIAVLCMAFVDALMSILER